MAISYDTFGVGGTVSPANSITYSHTVASTEPGLVGFIWIGDENGGSADPLTGVTYAGASCTTFKSQNIAGGRQFYGWKKTAPATGANNVIVSFANTVFADATSLSYTGVDQTELEDSSFSTTASTTLTLTTTTTADNCWLASGAAGTAAVPSASTGTTLRDTQGGLPVGDSNGAKSPAGSHSMAWTVASGFSVGAMIAIKPSTGSSSSTPLLTTLGVG